ncbi:MAG: PDZ domain-containing protein, partial [Thermoanaerobaculia bacterium]
MLRLARLLALTFAVLLAGATVGLGFLSFTRKAATFERAGFTYERAGGTLVVTSVEPGGAAARAGLAPGERIVTADGQSASSLAEPEESLARPAFPHRLLVQHGETEIREVLLARPRLVIDWKYLFLALVGLIYLSIGLFTLSRERTPAARVFWAICLSSFAINVLTNAGPHDTIWKAFWLTEDVYRALLPPLLLHFFLVFPVSAVRRRWLTLAYLPGLVYLAVQEAPLLLPGLDAARTARTFQGATRLWYLLFALYGSAVVVRLIPLLKKHAGAEAEAEKQIRWIGLGVVVGLSPFLVFSALPEALGVAAPWLSKISLLPLILIPLAFCYAILKWRLWDVEIFIREALSATAAVLLCGMTFVLLNALLDRTLEGIAEAGKNVVAFGSGLILASLLVPMKKRITGVLERFQYHETYRARRALLDIARDFSTPRPQSDLTAAIVERVDRGLHVVPCSLFRLEGGDLEDSEAELLEWHLAAQDVWRLRGPAFAPGTAARLYGLGYRSFFAMRCGGKLVGALGVGHKDGRVPLSSEDEALLVAVMA